MFTKIIIAYTVTVLRKFIYPKEEIDSSYDNSCKNTAINALNFIHFFFAIDGDLNGQSFKIVSL